MFVIEQFVGSRRGFWLRGRVRYPTAKAAQEAHHDATLKAMKGNFSPVLGRAVPV